MVNLFIVWLAPLSAIACFSDSMALLLPLAECSLHRRCAQPESRENTHSHLPNYRF